jgi:N-acetylneuraminic acid mutarotase
MRKDLLTLFLFISIASAAQSNLGWLQRAGFPGPARHRATCAAVGNRGYMGMGHINSVVDVLFDDWYEYDPGSDTWMQKANFPAGPRFHATSFVINNKIYVGTGRDVNANLYNDFYCYDPVTNTWSTIASYPGAGRRGAVGFTINGYGYVGTGSYHSNFYKYDPVNDLWTPIASLPGSGRISAVGFSIGNKGYVTTGDETGPMGDIWEYDPSFDSWTAKAPLPGLPRMEAGGFAMNGKGYVGCGDDYSSGTNYGDFWCFDPVTNSWSQIADFGGAARRYLSSFVIGNRAFCGLGTSGINYADLWEYGFISGVEENPHGSSCSAFPNPFSGQTTLHFSNELIDADYSIVDLNGKEVRKAEHVNGNEITIEQNELTTGVYILRVDPKNSPPVFTKLIIE